MTLNEDKPEKRNDGSASARYEELMGYGRYQKFMVWVFSPLVFFLGAMNMFQLVFMVTQKPSRCALPPAFEER